MIEIIPTEIQHLKQIAVIYHELGRCIRDQSLQREHAASTKVLVDVINRAERADTMESELRKFVYTASGYNQ